MIRDGDSQNVSVVLSTLDSVALHAWREMCDSPTARAHDSIAHLVIVGAEVFQRRAVDALSSFDALLSDDSANCIEMQICGLADKERGKVEGARRHADPPRLSPKPMKGWLESPPLPIGDYLKRDQASALARVVKSFNGRLPPERILQGLFRLALTDFCENGAPNRGNTDRDRAAPCLTRAVGGVPQF